MAEKTTRLSLVPITRLTFGVRYEPQYKILDSAGDLFDQILRATGTPFGPDTFPVTKTTVGERILANEDKGFLLRVNQADTILNWRLGESRNLEDIANLAKEFNDYVLTPLRNIQVANIHRYGLVLRFSLDKPKTSPLTHYVANDFPASGLTALVMRFSRRLASAEALWRTGVSDYRNINYALEESEEGVVNVSIDYQEYFQPLLDRTDWGKRPFTAFSNDAIAYFDTDIAKWLKTFMDTTEAVA